MGFGHVCHLFRASLPSSGHQLKPHQLSRQLRRVGRTGKKGEGMEQPQKPQEHFIQNTLNAAQRLNTVELVLPFTGREPATPALLTTFNCSCLHAHTTAQANGPTPLPRQLQLKFLQHRLAAQTPTALGLVMQQVPWEKWDTSLLLQNWNKSSSLPYGVRTSKHPNSKSTPILKWYLLKKKKSKCSIIRWKMQHSILLRPHLEKLVNHFLGFFL